jgi:hypothetical protein
VGFFLTFHFVRDPTRQGIAAILPEVGPKSGRDKIVALSSNAHAAL